MAPLPRTKIFQFLQVSIPSFLVCVETGIVRTEVPSQRVPKPSLLALKWFDETELHAARDSPTTVKILGNKMCKVSSYLFLRLCCPPYGS